MTSKVCNKCGQKGHMRSNHHRCPFNKRVIREKTRLEEEEKYFQAKAEQEAEDIFNEFYEQISREYKQREEEYARKAEQARIQAEHALEQARLKAEQTHVNMHAAFKKYCEEMEQECINEKGFLRSVDIPYPTKNSIVQLLNTSRNRDKAYKQLAKSWHPDRFMNKYHTRIHEDDKKLITAKITETFQMISAVYNRN